MSKRKYGRYWVDEYDEPMSQPMSSEDQDIIDDIEQEKEDLEQEEK